MTREEIKSQFPEATEEQITAILNINGTDLKNAKKNNVDPKELKRLQEIDAKYKELEEADLTDAEKVSKALKDAEEAKTNFEKQTNRLSVEKILVEAGLKEDEYKDIIDNLVSDDTEKSTTSATAFANLISSQKEATKKQLEEEMMNNTDKPGGTGGNDDEKTPAEKYAESLTGSDKEENTQTTESILDSYK